MAYPASLRGSEQAISALSHRQTGFDWNSHGNAEYSHSPEGLRPSRARSGHNRHRRHGTSHGRPYSRSEAAADAYREVHREPRTEHRHEVARACQGDDPKAEALTHPHNH